MKNATANKSVSPTNMTRVFEEGTAFYITQAEPESLMAQRGKEIKFLCTLDDREIPKNPIELRKLVKNLDVCDYHYLNIQFDTPSELDEYRGAAI